MARNCGSCGGGAPRRSTFRNPAAGSSGPANRKAAQVGSQTQYEVLTGSGKKTGRRFSSLIAATGYANRIGGSTTPV